MMRLIRRAVYAMGFFPKYGNPLFSPSLNVAKRYERTRKNAKPPTIIRITPTRVSVVDPDAGLIKNMLRTIVKYCPICGEVLWDVDEEKQCRNKCVKAGFAEDHNGLPIIAFGPIDLESQ